MSIPSFRAAAEQPDADKCRFCGAWDEQCDDRVACDTAYSLEKAARVRCVCPPDECHDAGSKGCGLGEAPHGLAREWHALSDHAADGMPFGGGLCNCMNLTDRLDQIANARANEAVRAALEAVEIEIEALIPGFMFRKRDAYEDAARIVRAAIPPT